MIAITSIRPTVAQPVATQWFAIALAPTAQRATFGLRDDVRQAAQLVQQSLDTIRRVPSNDQGSEGTKDARIAAFHLNTSAQALLEPHFTGTDAATLSVLRTADASLEDAAWQLAKKPSPDGRFNGVDIPGALADTQAALTALQRLA